MVKRVSRKKPGKFATILLGSWYDKRRRRPPETEGSCIYTDSRQEMVLQETGREGVDWINLAQDTDKWLTLVNTVMKLRFPHSAGKCLTSRRTISSSTRTKLHWVGWKISKKSPFVPSSTFLAFPQFSSITPLYLKIAVKWQNVPSKYWNYPPEVWHTFRKTLW